MSYIALGIIYNEIFQLKEPVKNYEMSFACHQNSLHIHHWHNFL